MIANDADLSFKVRKSTEKISENMHIIANEPSLAFYRIQEHVRRVLPLIVDRKAEVQQLQLDLQGHCYDMDYAVGAVKSIEASAPTFANIHEMLKNAIFLKQQLKFEETRRAKKESAQQSVYKRLSAHITLDLPDLPDLSGVVRETTNRMESMMTTTRHHQPLPPHPSASGMPTIHQQLQQQPSTSAAAAAVSSGSVEVLQRSYTTLH